MKLIVVNPFIFGHKTYLPKMELDSSLFQSEQSLMQGLLEKKFLRKKGDQVVEKPMPKPLESRKIQDILYPKKEEPVIEVPGEDPGEDSSEDSESLPPETLEINSQTDLKEAVEGKKSQRGRKKNNPTANPAPEILKGRIERK